jgi:hypothetical protein
VSSRHQQLCDDLRDGSTVGILRRSSGRLPGTGRDPAVLDENRKSIRSSTSLKPWERIHNPAPYRDTIDRGFLPGVSIQQAQFVRHVRNLLPRRIRSIYLPTTTRR